jgi:hypothetical protein
LDFVGVLFGTRFVGLSWLVFCATNVCFGLRVSCFDPTICVGLLGVIWICVSMYSLVSVYLILWLNIHLDYSDECVATCYQCQKKFFMR